MNKTQGLSKEVLLEKAVKNGAWKCLFFLIQEISANKSVEERAIFIESIKKLAETSGWNAEYQLLQSSISDVLSGKTVDINSIIKNAISESNKDIESTLLIATDENCSLHVPLVKKPADMRLKQMQHNVENEERVNLLVGTPPSGLLLMDSYLETDLWLKNCQEAPIADILRVHEYLYVKRVMDLCARLGENNDPEGTGKVLDRKLPLDYETFVSAKSYEVATKSAGVVLSAVDAVMKKKCRSAFCVIRPPGHHVGPWGAVEASEAPEIASLGFCLLNNVAIGAAYAMYNYRSTIKKIAIMDIDVHHGNGTEMVVRNLAPTAVDCTISRFNASLSVRSYKPW